MRNPPSSSDPPPPQNGGEVRVVRTHRIYRPFSRVVRLALKVATPPRSLGVGGIILGFGVLIALGTVLLSLPAAREPGTPWNLLTSFFTATSAVCVTGLIVVDTGTYWTTFGQAVILGLIQVGGLGVMTASLLILVILGRSISFRDRFDLREFSSMVHIRSVAALIFVIVVVTVLLEVTGAGVLWYRLHLAHPDGNDVWRAAFLAISAFNNAGFDIMGNYSSLALFVNDPLLLLVVALLAIAGGLNVLVLLELVSKRGFGKLSVTSKLVVVTSAWLLLLGFLGVFTAEFTNPKTLGPMSLADKTANAFFHSVTPRTAGFSTLPVNGLRDDTQFLTMTLMFIGGATGSTAGGIKVTTFAILVLATTSAIRGYSYTSGFGRRFHERFVYRALAIGALYLTGVFVGAIILTVTEPFLFGQVLFEVFSALGTVGLSTGITPQLTVAGKLIVVVMMFVGRLGPLTIAYALARRSREPRFQLPEGEVAIG